jgi:hypothetical protein
MQLEAGLWLGFLDRIRSTSNTAMEGDGRLPWTVQYRTSKAMLRNEVYAGVEVRMRRA